MKVLKNGKFWWEGMRCVYPECGQESILEDSDWNAKMSDYRYGWIGFVLPCTLCGSAIRVEKPPPDNPEKIDVQNPEPIPPLVVRRMVPKPAFQLFNPMSWFRP